MAAPATKSQATQPPSPEVPTPDEVQAPSFDPDPSPAEEVKPEPPTLERPPSAAAQWAILKDVQTKVEVMWLARQNASRRPVGKVTWACSVEDPPGSGLKCGNKIDSTGPGLPKDPPLICPKHGQSPHDLVE